MGKDITVISGYRSPHHNRKVGGARKSYHMSGKAADIDLDGFTNEESAEIVGILTSLGIGGVGSYTNSPNMLHVDLRPQRGGKPHFMHDKTIRNIKRAPDWMQHARERGVPTGPEAFQLTSLRASSDGIPLPTWRDGTSPAIAKPEPKSALDSQPVGSAFPTGTVEGYQQYARSRGVGLLGAEPATPQVPPEYSGPPAPRSDFSTGPTDPAPWVDDYAPAPGYPTRTASREHFERTFARPDPHTPMSQPGMSDRARATRDLADTMAPALPSMMDEPSHRRGPTVRGLASVL